MTGFNGQFVPPPPPVIAAIAVQHKKRGSKQVALILVALALLAGLLIAGARFLAEQAEAQSQRDLALGDRIIGSWILYMDNSGVGAYVNLKANGSLELTEGRLGEWMTTEHRLVEAEGSAYLEFYDRDNERWVRFMEIRTESDNQLRLIYLEP